MNTGFITDWRAWLTAAILAGYVTAFEAARRTPFSPAGDAEINRIIEQHIARCEIMESERTDYACDT